MVHLRTVVGPVGRRSMDRVLRGGRENVMNQNSSGRYHGGRSVPHDCQPVVLPVPPGSTSRAARVLQPRPVGGPAWCAESARYL